MAEQSSREGLALVLIVGVVAVVSMVMMAKGNATGYAVYGRQSEEVIKPLPVRSYEDYEKVSLYSEEEIVARYTDCMGNIDNEAYCACTSKGLSDCKDLYEVSYSGGIRDQRENPRYVQRYE